jgi:hypothetical protein
MRMRVIPIARILLCLGVLALFVVTANAGPITAGNLVVVQAGDGSATLSSAATAAFLKEYTTAGALQQTINLPTSVSGANQQLTLSGSSTSEGFLALSANGQYLTVAGYATATGTASITTSATIGRVAGRVDWSTGTVDTSTVLAAASADGNTGNPRSIVSNDGGQFWVGTSSGGVRYTTYGSTSGSTQLNTAAPTNTRVVNIYSGQLYMSSASGTYQGVGTVGSGLPTTSGQTPTLLNGFPTAAGPSNYDYFFADANTLYVADDRTTGSGGGLQKWIQSSGTWSLAYTLSTNLTNGLRGLAGTTDGLGNAILYATTADAIGAANGNKLVTVTDLISAVSLPIHSFTTLATAPGNTAFRGVELIVPEPATAGLAIIAGLLFAYRRRRSS